MASATEIDARSRALFQDNIIFDITPAAKGGMLDPGAGGKLSSSASGYGHPQCNPPTAGWCTRAFRSAGGAKLSELRRAAE
jgi:hypothetical protein